MKKLIKNIVILVITILPQVVSAQINLDDPNQFPLAEDLGLKKYTTAAEIAKPIFNAVLGLAGVIALAIILYGGFRWMTAAGNEDSVRDAKNILRSGTIGLVIILISWSIVYFIVRAVVPAP